MPNEETNPHLYLVQQYNWANRRASFNVNLYSSANIILFEDTANFNGMLTILDDNYLPTITTTSDNSALRNLAQSVIEFT